MAQSPRRQAVHADANKIAIDFDALVSGLLKVDPKKLPPKPGRKKTAGKKSATVTAKKARPKKA